VRRCGGAAAGAKAAATVREHVARMRRPVGGRVQPFLETLSSWNSARLPGLVCEVLSAEWLVLAVTALCSRVTAAAQAYRLPASCRTLLQFTVRG
jgi:hypothetical protein